jgi:thioesterase domain-containing protein
MTDTSSISEARRQLLEKFRRGELQTSSVLEHLTPRPLGAQGPLSPDLEQLWIHDRLSGAPINNESFTIHKRGPLDPEVLERCFGEIVRRHEIWRSAFPMIDGKVIQQVDSNVRVTLPVIDLSDLSAEDRERESLRIAAEDVRLPFDLNVAPLFRLRLVRWAPDYHRIFLTAHRLIFDCATIEHVLIGELVVLYRAFSAGQPSPLPELAFQYSDYAAWKHRQIVDGNQAAQMEYWRQKLSADLPALELPADRPRPAQPTWRSEMETCTLPASVVEGLQQLGNSEGATPYMILLAAFQVLLHRYSGQAEIVMGGKTNTRSRSEFEPLMGSFVNTIVYRNTIGAGLSFLDFLAQVKSTVLGALAHGDLPFDEIVRQLAPQRDPARNPLFRVLFSIRAPFGDFVDGWNLTDMEVHSGACGFDLFVEFAEHLDTLAGRFVYSTDLFDGATTRRFVENFQVLLQQLLADPNQIVSEVPLAAEIECHTPPDPEPGPEPQREYVPPQDEIEERLANVWQDLLGIHPVSVTDSYFDLGGHSLLAVRLFSEIKFCFKVDLPLGTLFHAPTVRTLAAIVRDSGAQTPLPVVPIQPHGEKPPIFCIGALNGEVILFRRLALELGADQPLYGLQPFSLAERPGTVEELAACYIEQLRLWGEPRPFCLLGYSFGGLVAVEMARQLRKNGAEPAIVALIDTSYLAGSKALEPWKDRIRRYRYHVKVIVHGANGFRHLGERLRSRIFRVIHKVSTTVGVGMPKIASDIFGRQLLAGENYRAKPYPGRVLLFVAASKPEFFNVNPGLSWRKFLSNLQVEDVPGDHGTINTGTNLKVLAQKLTAAAASGLTSESSKHLQHS